MKVFKQTAVRVCILQAGYLLEISGFQRYAHTRMLSLRLYYRGGSPFFTLSMTFSSVFLSVAPGM